MDDEDQLAKTEARRPIFRPANPESEEKKEFIVQSWLVSAATAPLLICNGIMVLEKSESEVQWTTRLSDHRSSDCEEEVERNKWSDAIAQILSDRTESSCCTSAS